MSFGWQSRPPTTIPWWLRSGVLRSTSHAHRESSFTIARSSRWSEFSPAISPRECSAGQRFKTSSSPTNCSITPSLSGQRPRSPGVIGRRCFKLGSGDGARASQHYPRSRRAHLRNRCSTCAAIREFWTSLRSILSVGACDGPNHSVRSRGSKFRGCKDAYPRRNESAAFQPSRGRELFHITRQMAIALLFCDDFDDPLYRNTGSILHDGPDHTGDRRPTERQRLFLTGELRTAATPCGPKVSGFECLHNHLL